MTSYHQKKTRYIHTQGERVIEAAYHEAVHPAAGVGDSPHCGEIVPRWTRWTRRAAFPFLPLDAGYVEGILTEGEAVCGRERNGMSFGSQKGGG